MASRTISTSSSLLARPFRHPNWLTDLSPLLVARFHINDSSLVAAGTWVEYTKNATLWLPTSGLCRIRDQSIATVGEIVNAHKGRV
jgi:hypothetical protein